MSKKSCPNCEGIMDASYSEIDENNNQSPIWKCRCCWQEFPRRTWTTKKRAEKIAMYKDMLEAVLLEEK